MGHASNRDKVNGIRAYSLENDTLDVTLSVFKAGKKIFNEISFGLDLTSVNDEQDLIHFSPDKNQSFHPRCKC